MLPSCAQLSFQMYPNPGSAFSAHRSTTKFKFSPHFPEGSVNRYPSLTRALANNYPGLVDDDTDGDQSTACFSPDGAQESFPLSPSGSFSVSASPNLGSSGGRSADDRNSNTLNVIPILLVSSLTRNPILRRFMLSRNQDCVLLDAEDISRRSSLTERVKHVSLFLRLRRALILQLNRRSKRPKTSATYAADYSVGGLIFTSSCRVSGRSCRPGSLFAHVRRHEEPPGPFFKCGTCQQPFLRLAHFIVSL